ncbi:UDP-N-acetylglucosamine 2-epimerase (non-hydrolyzing) [uncultured Algoriphagus sp.]|uniref:non-hydrolyzing UDP-N-acetylglucosamine 2-epimerase n=1 Tax=uncultured Algoriphagus sp. TaxID=417365 RepID=UPI002592FCAC|nr:UDP-N-acetylglucosamine 2-epimerase (non-hydrolyzing) [uncultured Algoriphagus sp.]
MTKTIAIIFGTRPEAIKLVPVIEVLSKYESISLEIILTGQHKEMLEQVVGLFSIKPSVNFQLMRDNQSLGKMSARLIESLYEYFIGKKIDLVIVQGDTASTLNGALAAYYHKIPIAYVEAGLRTGNIYSPWPEEGNRLMVSQLAEFLFAPTEANRKNLIKEGFDNKSITVTGNTSIDTLLLLTKQMKSQEKKYSNYFSTNLFQKPIILITGHRRENFGEGFENICEAIRHLASLYEEHNFVYPVHLNPNVREPVERILTSSGLDNIFLLEPLEYDKFVYLMMNSKIILTDSGGIQEEAPSLGKPVLVMRENTERPEAISAGTSKLVGTDKSSIISGVRELLDNQKIYERMSKARNPYGDGNAAKLIAESCIQYLKSK